MSAAGQMFKHRGAEFCRSYVERPEGMVLYSCDRGHPDCAHYKRGPCIKEMLELLGVQR